MQFTLHDIELNLSVGSVTLNDGSSINIRAKTLLVLKHLITHKHKIVTKQELLDAIWHDVVVQEQVLVQSIKEIRHLLGSDVIKTYPRQGYQWTAELTIKTPKSLKSTNYPLRFLVVILSILIITTITVQQTFFNESDSPEEFRVAFLPIKNDMPDNIHGWVPLEGMDYLRQTLKQKSHLTVIENQLLLEHLTSKQLNLGFVDNPQKTNVNLANIQATLATDLIVQTRLVGYPQDFLLQYTLHLKHNTERGIIFSDDIKNAFDQLNLLLKQRFDDGVKENSSTLVPYKSNFSHEAFSRGIGLYHRRQYQKAIPFFTTALEDDPTLLAARRSLAASYVNIGDTKQGIALMLENIKQAKLNENIREEIRSNLMLGVLLINKHQKPISDKHNQLNDAENYIERSKLLATENSDNLFLAYAYEELGKIKRLREEFSQAITDQKKSLEIHKGFDGKYGQTTALIEIARNHAAQNQFVEANNRLKQAIQIANENGVATNKVAILLAWADLEKLQDLDKSANRYAQQAMNVAKAVKREYLIAQVNAWLNKNSHYEIN